MQPAVIGGNMVLRLERGRRTFSGFIVTSTEPTSGANAFEAAHGLVAALDAAMILLSSVVEIAVGLMAQAASNSVRVARG